MSRFVIDLDHTLCVPHSLHQDSHHRYALADPIPDVIQAVQRLYANGHYIILHTARRMVTHHGDIAKVEADVGQITRDWLTQHAVPYHELVFGKPYGDFYVDDKAVLPISLTFLAQTL